MHVSLPFRTLTVDVYELTIWDIDIGTVVIILFSVVRIVDLVTFMEASFYGVMIKDYDVQVHISITHSLHHINRGFSACALNLRTAP